MPQLKHCVFYGNSSLSIGSGHIMRLLALAQWLQKVSFKLSFIYKEYLNNSLEKLQEGGFCTTLLQNPLSAEQIKGLNPSHLIIDDYNLSEAEWRVIKMLPCFKIVFDDALNSNPIVADLIINSSTFADLNEYKKRAPNSQFCLGPEFTLLRQEFIRASALLPLYKERNSILITMGGTDVLGLSLDLCTYFLKHYPLVPIQIMLGTSNAQQVDLLQNLTSAHHQLQVHINPQNVAEIMAKSRIAISAAGGTLKELACMQVPTLALVCADNQAAILSEKSTPQWYKAYDFRNYIAPLEQISNICSEAYSLYENEEQRMTMVALAKKAISTQGGQHIVDKITTLTHYT